MLNLTAHFTELELTRSRSFPALASSFELLRSRPAANLMRLAITLEEFRQFWGGRPILINSAYRGPALNERVGGSSSSRHLAGLAADITVDELNAIRAFGILAGALLDGEPPAFDRCTLYSLENRLHIDLDGDPKQPGRRNLFVDSGAGWEPVGASDALELTRPAL